MSDISSPQRIDKILSSKKTFLLIKICPQFTIAPKMHGGWEVASAHVKYACDSNLERESFVSILMARPQLLLSEKPILKPNTYYNS